MQKVEGYIVVVDGDTPVRIKRGHVFAPGQDENGDWKFFGYWNPETDLQEASKWAIRKWARAGKITRVKTYTYAEMEDEILRAYPQIWIPEEKTFCMEFGLKYDGHVLNPRGLRGD